MILFITANEHERTAFEKKFTNKKEKYIDSKAYYLGEFACYPSAHIHVNKQGINNPESVRLAGELIRELKPCAVVMVGIAFGADKEAQNIGDVLVSETILPYDDIKQCKEQTVYKEHSREGGRRLLNAFRECREWEYKLSDSTQSSVYVGALLTGSCLIDSYDFRTKLLEDFKDNKPIGGDMEAFGIYREARMFDVSEWIIVKAICDWAYDKNVDEEQKENNQESAANAAVDYCFHVFSRDGVFVDFIQEKCGNHTERDNLQQNTYNQTINVKGDNNFVNGFVFNPNSRG
jgi:nucleoside phosphorylase